MKLVFVLISSSLLVAGCSILPPRHELQYDGKAQQTEGTIALSYPKLYSRSALLEERRRDIDWLSDLLKDSANPNKVKFVPEIARELETISAFAAALGLSFDPAAGVAYRQSQETNEIQQEIDVLRLQLQLDQLRRDAEIMRANLPSQDTPVNEDLGNLSSGSDNDQGEQESTATSQLDAAIARLITEISDSFNAEGRLPTSVDRETNPLDDFRDRTAYRDLIKSEINSAKLDELHDLNGSNLIRLNFQATILPDMDHLRSIGAIEVRIIRNEPDVPLEISEWLIYLNTTDALRENGRFVHGSPERGLYNNNLLTIVEIDEREFLFPKDDLLIQAIEGIAMSPNLTEASIRFAIELSSQDISDRADWLSAFCQGQRHDAIKPAIRAILPYLHYRAAIQRYRGVLKSLTLGPVSGGKLGAIRINLATLDQVVDSISDTLADQPGDCESILSSHQPPFYPGALVSAVEKALTRPRHHIYDVGPRQQVQQVSTVARNANSLALAASIAATVPASGVGADAAASYTKTASTLAAAIERIPAVVGFSRPASTSSDDPGAFGWVFGPPAALDQDGHVVLRHGLATHDLSVDLSVPGMWRDLTLEVRTAWGANPAQLSVGGVSLKHQVRFEVPLKRYGTAFSDLTTVLLDQLQAPPSISGVYGGPINACQQSTVVVEGMGLWRTQSAMVLGQLIELDKIRVLPDMGGIFFSVPKVEPIGSIGSETMPEVVLFTPNGVARAREDLDGHRLTYEPNPSGKKCSEEMPTPAPAPDPNAPTVTKIDDGKPLRRSVPASLTFKLYGTNLDQLTHATLGGIAATIAPGTDGSSATITIDRETSEGIAADVDVPLILTFGSQTTQSYEVEITRSGGTP